MKTTSLFFIVCCVIGCSDPSVPYSEVWEDSDDTTSPDGGSDEPSDDQSDASDTDLSSVPTDSASDVGSDSGSGDVGTGTATFSDTESETATVEDTVTTTDSVTASETVSTGVDPTDETSGTGETVEDTSTGMTAVDTGSGTPSETVDTGEDTEGEWQDPSSGLIWETFLEPHYAPPGSSYSNMNFRCENKGMRIPTGPEARTLMVNCDGYFIPDCEWEDATGYYHCQIGGMYDPEDCKGPSFLNDRLWNSNEYIMTSSEIGDEGRHLQWFLSKDYEADPLKYPRMFTKELSGGGFYTICVK